MNMYWGPRSEIDARARHASASARSVPELPTKDIGLVLQGGGALGAYEAGAVIKLLEAGYRPSIVAGTSIGAINACVIAAPRDASPAENLRNLWTYLRNDPPLYVPEFQRKMIAAMGHPRFYSMRFDVWNAQSWPSMFEIGPALKTIRKFVDFDFLNSDDCATVVMTATNIETGELVRFSNRTHKLTPEHLMASGALPPSFPPVLIDGAYYWDGGLYDNTPIQSVLRILNDHEIETLPIFVIEVFSATGTVPRTMSQALDRMTELVYEDKFWKMFEGASKASGFAAALGEIDKIVGPDHPLRQDPHFSALMHYRAISHVFTIQATKSALSSVSDFSSGSVETRLNAGYQAAVGFLEAEEPKIGALLARGRQVQSVDDPADAFESTAFVAKSFVTSDKLKLTYRTYGAALPENPARPALLAVPGLTLNVRDFDPMASILGENHRIYALNLRGRDTSDYDPRIENYRTSVYVRDIYEFWQHLDIGPVALLGTSLGGVLAMLMAQDHPDMLAGIILNDVGAELEMAGMQRIGRGYSNKPVAATDFADLVAALKLNVGGQFAGLDDREWERIVHSIYVQSGGVWQPRYDRNIARAMIEHPEPLRDLWAAHRTAAELGLPVLSLRGAVSDVTSKATIAKMKSMAPSMTAVEIPKRGHWPLLNEPASLRALKKFLAGLEAPKTKSARAPNRRKRRA